MKKEYRSFDDARKFVRRLKLSTQKDWQEYCNSGNKPDDIPKSPYTVWKNKGWISSGDFFGTGRVATYNIVYQSFKDAKKLAQSLNLKSRKEWVEYTKSGKKPDDIPTNVSQSYKKEWEGWGDFLGTGSVAPNDRKFCSFKDAKKFVRKLKFKNRDDWKKYCRSGNKPDNIPVAPDSTYKKQWTSWGDFSGTGRVATQNRIYQSFKESRSFVQKLNLKYRDEFKKLVQEGKIPKDIPSAPNNTYKNKGWTGWGDFLGTGWISPLKKSKNLLSYDDAKKEARKWAKKYNLKSWDDWIKAHKEGKIPKILPQRPDKTYSKKRKK